MLQKKRVGLDFDDVLIDFVPSLLTFHNEKHGTLHRKEDIKSFGFWGNDPLEVVKMMREFVHSKHHEDILPKAGAVEAIKMLKEECTLFVVTARDDSLSHQTLTLANMYFPESFHGVHFLHHDGINTRGTKGRVCAELGIEVFVEDSLENAIHVGEIGIQTLLFDTPWNQTNTLPKNTKRVFSWGEVTQEILGIS